MLVCVCEKIKSTVLKMKKKKQQQQQNKKKRKKILYETKEIKKKLYIYFDIFAWSAYKSKRKKRKK